VRCGLHGLHAMSFAWPEHKVDLAEAAELFARAWRARGESKTVHRSSLSRFVADKGFPFEEGKRGAKLVDAKALFEAYTTNFTRAVMAGETGNAPQSFATRPSAPAAAPEREPGDDPKFRQAQIKVIESELDLAERLNQTVPAAEVTAGAGEAIASLRSAFAEARADAVSRILQLFGRPESDARLVREELKRFERAGQEKFAAAFAAFLTPDGHAEAAAREKLARAAEIAEALDADPRS
jgi:hypothetical protein